MDKIEVKDGMIPFSEFGKIDLRIGTITDVKDHPNAEKLYVLQVDLGNEKRQLVAGLKGIYKDDELKNKQVIVVCNLEPKELRGVKSHGMLLASEDGTILAPEKKVKNGSKVM
jgi:methionyl-tRNA synthetase